ncbi:hypothetical protein KBC31_00850 [Candidatus Saccharibacteria bacterium]|nr:hypothetical protein [Candidatus Saccharibacteria bacterium]
MDDQNGTIKYVPDHFSIRAKQAASILVSQRNLLCSGYGTKDFETKSNANDILTKIDTKVEQNLKAAFADVGELLQGEELGYNPDLTEPFWICDPIDGTGCYVRQQPFCVSMIAYIVDGDVEISFIYDFLTDKLYSAERGKGSFCNSEPIRVSNRKLDELKGIVIGSLDDRNYIETFSYFKNHSMNTYSVFSAGNEFVEIAAGRTDIKIAMPVGNMDWDRAAGMLLVREAGGVYKRLDGSDASFKDKSFIATNKIAYQQIINDPESSLYLGNK